MYETSFKLPNASGAVAVSMRMKTFMDHDHAAVEKKVNDWMCSNHVNVRHIAQSQSEKSGKFVFIISLFYTS